MFTTRPELQGTFGMCASTHWLASSTGMSVLERGGNAFDAAVAMAFVLHVAEPHMCGPGGDAPIMFSAAGGPVRVLCGQGPAPAAATIEHYRAEGLDLIPATGLLAPAVPGAVTAWFTLLRDHGTWTVADVLAPAIDYAERGVPVHAAVADTIASVASLFRRDWPSSAALWLDRAGDPPTANALFRNPALAATLRRLADTATEAGRSGSGSAAGAGSAREAGAEAALRAWTSGFVAEAIDRHAAIAAPDGIGGHYQGVLNGEDMARWQPPYEDPVTLTYHGVDVHKCGPWSQGPVLLQSLAILAGTDIAELEPTSAPFVHLAVEAMKLAYADREKYYGDPDFVAVPLDTLLSVAYNDGRRQLLGERASLELRPGDVAGHGGQVDYAAAVARTELIRRRSAGAGEPITTGTAAAVAAATSEPVRAASRPSDTVHLDVADRFGNMVSATPSGGWLQASPAIAELGFCLGTRVQMFTLEAGQPTTLEPHKRPRTTLTPSMASRDGRPWMAFGTPGGDGQDQWQLAFLLRVLHGGMNLAGAIDAPAFHSDHWPSSFWPRHALPGRLVLESRFDDAVVAELAERGHDVRSGPPWSEGRMSAVTSEERDGETVFRAAANPRGMAGYAVGR